MTAAPSGSVLHPAEPHDTAWWRHAVIYQIYPRSWADSTGDGVGDLPGITSRLPYLRDLGVDAVWLSPFYVSPMADGGYDVADYTDVDPMFGTLADVDELIGRAHELGLRVMVDIVPNHSSDEHHWFRAALAAGPGSAERGRYHFRDGRGPAGDSPPNNWKAVFGGPAWTRVRQADGTPGQWYLHLFDPKQPDFNWDNPQVREMFHEVLRFWLDRGTDGFRVDVAHALVKAEGLPDWTERTGMLGSHEEALVAGPPATHREQNEYFNNGPMWDQPGVHEVYRGWRTVLESYNPEGDPQRDRILCAEAWNPETHLCRRGYALARPEAVGGVRRLPRRLRPSGTSTPNPGQPAHGRVVLTPPSGTKSPQVPSLVRARFVSELYTETPRSFNWPQRLIRAHSRRREKPVR